MFKSATQILASIQRGEMSSDEALTELLNRITQVNPKINAVVQLDVERATTRAKAADEALAKGESWGPLHGLPMTVKDAFEVEGVLSTSGAHVWKNHIPNTNAEPIQKLVDAGAIIFGKTNVPIFSGDWQAFNDIYGHKPSHGIIPMNGHLPPPPGATAGQDTLSVVGPLARRY